MINYQLADFSNIAIVIAIGVYVMAFIAFSIDLAQVVNVRSERKLEAKAQVAGAGGAEVADAAKRGKGPIRAAMTLSMIATAIQIVGVVARGIATHRVPWGNMYEFSMAGAAVTMLMFLILCLRLKDLRHLGIFVLAPALFLMLIAQTLWFLPAAQLTPSLQNSHWLVIHVSVAILGSALFAIGAVTSLLQILQQKREKRILEGKPARFQALEAVLEKLPNAKQLEALSFQINAVGFVMWTFTLIFGAIWANKAWSRYWGWDPKEVWTFVIWIVYAAYMHARATRGFRGSRAAWFSIAGFLCVVFNYTVVNTVINGLHSYSGL